MPNTSYTDANPLQTLPEQRSWVDENTGRRVQQLTDEPNGALLGYFRNYRHLPDGRMLITIGDYSTGALGALDPESGELEALPYSPRYIKLLLKDGRMWYLKRAENELWTTLLPYGEPELVAQLPPDVTRIISDITCDGKTLILEERVVEKRTAPTGTTDAEVMWDHFRRKRSGSMFAFDIASGARRKLLDTQDVCTFHLETSPTDPTLIRYAEDVLECAGQRIYTIRTDGSDKHAIRPQEFGEMITHEFWWADPNSIGFTYMDRRGDTTVHELPWSEYAPVTTHLGIANLEGEQIYLSDALNSYHSHMYVSRDGNMVTGEGTDGNSFVFAAPFSPQSTKVDFVAMATIHTPYCPMRGQNVHADLSIDNRWLLYNDTIDGRYQVCRVLVDF